MLSTRIFFVHPCICYADRYLPIFDASVGKVNIAEINFAILNYLHKISPCTLYKDNILGVSSLLSNNCVTAPGACGHISTIFPLPFFLLYTKNQRPKLSYNLIIPYVVWWWCGLWCVLF